MLKSTNPQVLMAIMKPALKVSRENGIEWGTHQSQFKKLTHLLWATPHNQGYQIKPSLVSASKSGGGGGGGGEGGNEYY